MRDRGKDTGHKRILFPIGERELSASSKKLFELPEDIAARGHHMDIMTCQDDVYKAAEERFRDNGKIRIISLKSENRFWTMIQRDSFTKTFIKLMHDIYVPGTDFKYWKQVGFDDFLWNVSSDVFPNITEQYDLVLLPIPSSDESPKPMCDVFYTHIMFYARQNGIPVAGLQIFPISEIPAIYAKIIDYFIVKEKTERDYFVSIGVDRDRVFVVDVLKDKYCISTVEDTYKNLLFNEQIPIERDRLGIIVVNHAKNRYQLYDIIDALSELDMKISVFFCLVKYAVRDLHEDDVMRDLISPYMEKKLKKYYAIELNNIIKVLMFCDVIISTNYIVPTSFAGRYHKLGVVHNPLKKDLPFIDDVIFTNSKRALKDEIKEYYEKKQKMVGLSDILERIRK